MTHDESTKLKAARAETELRIVVFWDGGSASRPLAAGAEIVIGRSDECDLVVADDSVSRRHARVRGGSPPTIEDLGSANGTSVGDQRLAPRVPAPLSPSTVVELGDALLTVRAPESTEPTPRAPPSTRAPASADPLDPPMARVEELVALVASADIPVIVLGETGVGKGVLAENLHRRSPRAGGPFVRINCAAFAESLLESELFGHEKAAFTGAIQAKAGLIESADRGTLLLDEIGDMPLATQAKLLHAIEHGEVLRVGGLKPRPVRVRFVAATNKDLSAEVAAGRFRQDLFFRLDGVTITIPPLRQRPSEIPALARRFAGEASAQMGRGEAGISDAAIELLLAHTWPGNVRELRNVMVRAALFARGGRIGVEHFELAAPHDDESASAPALRAQVRDLEQRRILEALARVGDNQVAAAKALGIARGTLRSRMRELGLLASDKRPRREKP